MKKKGLIAFVVAGIMVLSGCSYNFVNTKNNKEQESVFVCVEKTHTWIVVYHKSTKVMYAVSNSGEGSGCFTLLVNPDGTPMIWED